MNLFELLSGRDTSSYNAAQDPFQLGQNAAGYLATPEYQDLLSKVNAMTGGDYSAYTKSLSDVGQMQTLAGYQGQALEGLQDYRLNNVFGSDPNNRVGQIFSGLLDDLNLYQGNVFNQTEPVGTYNGKTVYPDIGFMPGAEDAYKIEDGNLRYIPVNDDSGFGFDSLLSVATGGMSDIVQGNGAFSDVIQNIGLDDKTANWLTGAVSQFNPITGGVVGQLQEGYKAGAGDGSFDWGAAIDRAVDPAGTIDYSVRAQGELQNEIVPELTPYYKAAGPIIGGIVGSYVPVVGTAVGSAIGSGIGSKMTGGLHDFNYGSDLVDAGIAYVAADATQGIAPGVSELAGGGVVGGIAGGAAQGAVKGGLTGVKPALQTGEWDPVLYGAGLGGVVGGITGGINAYGDLNSPENLAYEYAQAHPGEQIYLQSPEQAMMDEAYFYAQTHPGTWVDSETGQIHPWYGVGTPESMYPTTPTGGIPYAPANPSGMYPLDAYNNIQYAPAAPEVAYPLASNAERLNAFEAEPQFASDYIHPYNLGSGHGADVEIGSTNYDPHNTYFKDDPSIAGSVGKFVLDNSSTLLKLASLLGGGTAGAVASPSVFPGGGRPGMASPDAVTEFLMQHGGTGKGKSKGLKAGAVEGPYYGDSFMPGLKEINKYDEQGLYYT